jgi:hypothetical protein
MCRVSVELFCSNCSPDIAQLVERSTVDVAVIEWSLVRFRVSGVFDYSRHLGYHLRSSKNEVLLCWLRDSIVVSISACHADDPGSIPGRGGFRRPRKH